MGDTGTLWSKFKVNGKGFKHATRGGGGGVHILRHQNKGFGLKRGAVNKKGPRRHIKISGRPRGLNSPKEATKKKKKGDGG